MKISIIAALSENRLIGLNNRLPWHIPEDLKWFKKTTMGHPVIMGRKTFESLQRPFPGRKNIVLSTRINYKASGAFVCRSIDEAIKILKDGDEKEIFIIGGGQVFKKTLPRADRIYITIIHKEIEGDTFFPVIPEDMFKKVFREAHFERRPGNIPEDITFSFEILDRVK